MKQIFFNYFLCGEPFKENRMAYDRDQGPALPALGQRPMPDDNDTEFWESRTGILEDMAATVKAAKAKDVYSVLDRKNQEIADLRREIEEGNEHEARVTAREEMQKLITERTRRARDMLRESREIRTEMDNAAKSADALEEEARQYRDSAAKLKTEGSPERTEYINTRAQLDTDLVTAKQALENAEAAQRQAPRAERVNYNAEISAKKAEVERLQALIASALDPDAYADNLIKKAEEIDTQVAEIDHQIAKLNGELEFVEKHADTYLQHARDLQEEQAERAENAPQLTHEQIEKRIVEFDALAKIQAAERITVEREDATANGADKPQIELLPGETPEQAEERTAKERIEKTATQIEADWQNETGEFNETGITEQQRAALHQKLDNGLINTDSLSINSRENIATTAEIFINDLGLPENSVLLMAHELDYVNTDEFKSNHQENASPEVRKEREIFLNPTIDNIDQLGPDHKGFIFAWKFYNMVRNEVSNMAADVSNTKKNLSESNREPVFTTAVDTVQRIGRDAAEAVRNRDYGKIAMYGLLGAGIYKFYKDWLKPKLAENPSAEGASLFSKFAHYVPYIGAIYAGGWLLAPEKMKTLMGGLRNRDFAGTIFADFEETRREAGDQSCLKKIDMPTLFSFNNARVGDVFGPITPTSPNYDERYDSHHMIPLTVGAARNFYDSALLGQGPGAINALDAGKPLTAKQKEYVDKSTKLYDTMTGLREYYYETVGRDGISFEDRFLNRDKTGVYVGDLTMGDMYQMFKNYLTPAKTTGDIVRETVGLSTGKQRIGEDLTGAGEKTAALAAMLGSSIEVAPGTSNILATAFGFPISIKAKTDQGQGGKTVYMFYVRGKETSEDRHHEYVVGTPSSTIVGEVEGMIRERIMEFMNTREAALDGRNPVELRHDGTNWFYPITVPPRFLMGEVSGKRIVTAKENGDIQLTFQGHELATLNDISNLGAEEMLLDDIFKTDKSNFGVLSCMRGQITIPREDHSSTDVNQHNFDLLINGVTATIKIVGEKYFMEKADQKKIIDTEGFAAIYAESILSSSTYDDEFKKINEAFSRLNSELSKERVQGTLSNARGAITGEYPFANIFDGSIRNNFLRLQLSSKREFLKNILIEKVSLEENFEGLTNAQNELNTRFSEIKAYASRIDSLTFGALTADKVRDSVLDPLRSLSFSSTAYYSSFRDFESLVILKKMNISDLSDSNLSKATQLYNVYYYYTAELDNTDLDQRIDPATDDVGAELLLKKREYLKFVIRQMYNNIDLFLENKGPSATPSDPKWGITKFDEWKNTAVLAETAIDVAPDYDQNSLHAKLRSKYDKVAEDFERNSTYNHYAPLIKQIISDRDGKAELMLQVGDIISDYYITTLSQQNAKIDALVEDFRRESRQILDKAISDNLSLEPGFGGKTKVWLWDNFHIELGNN